MPSSGSRSAPSTEFLPREQLTVGALRAQATDVDLGYRSSERLRKTGTDTITVLDLAAKLPT